jgi:hypothetical protein
MVMCPYVVSQAYSYIEILSTSQAPAEDVHSWVKNKGLQNRK